MCIYQIVHSVGQSHMRFPGNLLVSYIVHALGFYLAWTECITWTEIQAQVISDASDMVTQGLAQPVCTRLLLPLGK